MDLLEAWAICKIEEHQSASSAFTFCSKSSSWLLLYLTCWWHTYLSRAFLLSALAKYKVGEAVMQQIPPHSRYHRVCPEEPKQEPPTGRRGPYSLFRDLTTKFPSTVAFGKAAFPWVHTLWFVGMSLNKCNSPIHQDILLSVMSHIRSIHFLQV